MIQGGGEDRFGFSVFSDRPFAIPAKAFFIVDLFSCTFPLLGCAKKGGSQMYDPKQFHDASFIDDAEILEIGRASCRERVY
jgi:hypothetical protein